MSNQIFFGLDASRIQRARQGAGQSPAYAGNHIVQCGRIFGTFDLASVFILVKVLDAPVDAEMDWFGKLLDMCGPMGPLVFLDADSTGVGNCHDMTSFKGLN
jgi:hypothetical protein